MAYISNDFIKKNYGEKNPPWGPIGYIVYKRTYARVVEETGLLEEWQQTCQRCCNGLMEINPALTQEELEFLYDTMFNLRGTVSGRALWQLGTPTVRKIGSDSLANCWHVAINDISAFTFTFNQLMLGGGVGFNALPEHVYELSRVSYKPVVERVTTNDCDFIVPDNREGWVELLHRVLESFFYTGKNLRYSTNCVRHHGEKIKGFGGVASGPEELVVGIGNIAKILESRYMGKLTPMDCVDIMNIIGTIVVAGNVRRSSEIALGDVNDVAYLNAKNWQKYDVPNWRAMSNNSCVANTFSSIRPEFWLSGYTPNERGEMEGEPYGLVNLKNCKEFGRLADGRDPYNDPTVVGVNPCAEITLANKECCNLAEIFLPNIKDEEEFKKVAEILFKACKIISSHGFSDPDTNAIVHQNHRIGVGITGYMEAPEFHDRDILTRVYLHMKKVDREFSQKLGLNVSVKRTTVKPSGTLSLLAGVTPGMHAALSRYMMRTVRFSASNPLVRLCRDHGYRIEPKLEFDGTVDHGTMVIYFPVKMSDKAVLASELTVIDQLETQKFLQTYWSDNAVSATHYFKPHEVPLIKEWLAENYDDGVKTASFLQEVGHGFKQAPIQPISKEEYEEAVKTIKPFGNVSLSHYEGVDDNSLECEGGHCPVK